jgi:hypothetical protein
LPPKGGFHLGLFVEGELTRRRHLLEDPSASSRGEVGYWLAESAQGRGLATRAAARWSSSCSARRASTGSRCSPPRPTCARARVCERLGFRLEASRRGSHRFPNGFNDHLVYARLVTDVVPGNPPRRLLTADEFRALLDRLAAAWHARQYAAAASCFAEDVAYGDPMRYALHGRAALRGFFEEMRTASSASTGTPSSSIRRSRSAVRSTPTRARTATTAR